MKRMLAMIMLCLLLAGCGAPEIPETTAPPAQTVSTTAVADTRKNTGKRNNRAIGRILAESIHRP